MTGNGGTHFDELYDRVSGLVRDREWSETATRVCSYCQR